MRINGNGSIGIASAPAAGLALAVALAGCGGALAVAGVSAAVAAPSESSAQQDAMIRVETEGMGVIAWAYEDEEIEFDDDMPFQSAYINDAYGQTIHIEARDYAEYEGFHFVKWTKDGKDFSTENRIDVPVDADASYIAVFDFSEDDATEAPDKLETDYLVLVNGRNELPQGWEDALETVVVRNSLDDAVEVETRAYDAYLDLKADLEADGVMIDLDSAYRSVEAQQRIVKEFTEKYGEDYVRQYVAVPGYSEHHTGLALDLYLNIDGEDVYLNEDMVEYPEVWEQIHAKLADHGFILRYLEGKEDITGYSYEPWHIRYVADPAVAHDIMDAGITLEEYLGAADDAAGYAVDLGTSELYTTEEIDAAIDVAMAEFDTWTGAVMQQIAFTDDATCEEDVAYCNELRDANIPEFDQAIVLVSSFHSPSGEDAEGTAWNPDADYEGWTWHLARTDGGDWQLLTWGYN